MAMRESGYVDSYPQRGNHSRWLTQDDGAPNARTVLATRRSAEEMVLPDEYEEPGGTLARSGIETLQPLVDGSREGWICRRNQGTGNPLMALKIDDRYAYEGPATVTVTVTYLDRGSDSWRLTYDVAGDANKVAGTIFKGDSGAWLVATFNLDDAWLANRQSGGADLTIDSMGDGDEYIHLVDVSRFGRFAAAPGMAHGVAAGPTPIDGHHRRTRQPRRRLRSRAGGTDARRWAALVALCAWRPGYVSTLTTLDVDTGFYLHLTETGVLQITGRGCLWRGVAGRGLEPDQLSVLSGPSRGRGAGLH